MKKLLSLLAFALALPLGGCIFFYFGDKFMETTPCPLNRDTGRYEIKLGKKSDTITPLKIPKNFSPRCSTYYRVPGEKPIQQTYFSALYPDMTPLVWDSDKPNGVNIFLKPLEKSAYAINPSDIDRAIAETGYIHDLTAHIASNIGADDGTGKKRFAPVKEFENGFFALSDNWQPDYHLLFQKNSDGRIKNLFYCHIQAMSCSSEGITLAGMYVLRYSANGIDYRTLPELDAKVKSLVSGFRQGGAE